MSAATVTSRPKHRLALVPQIGVGLTILLQICWPLVSGSSLAKLTILTVVVFAATSISHAWIHRGGQWAARYAATTILFAFGIEWLGISTGFPFTSYAYSDDLGPALLGVPLLIPLAWAMAAYPALLLARTLAGAAVGNRWLVSAIGAFAMTAWDLFLDPQMVSAGYWTWESPVRALPGVPGIPALNFAGWLLSSFVLMVLLSPLPNEVSPAGLPAAQGVPAILWAWMWVGGVVSNAFFFGRPSVALVGGLAMAVVSIPYFRRLWHNRAPERGLVAA